MAATVPASLRAIKPFVIIHSQFEKKDPTVSYYVLMYAVQVSLSTTNPEAKAYLLSMLDKLEKMKKECFCDPDGFPDAEVAKVYIEECALKLFDHADQSDRAAIFSKSVSKCFFTASQIFTSLKQFGELSEDIEGKMKYAKWKAVEIDKCLKSGITPTPGPPGGFQSTDPEQLPPTTAYQPPDLSTAYQPPDPSTAYQPPGPSTAYQPPGPSTAYQPPGSSTVPTIGFGYPPAAPVEASYQAPVPDVQYVPVKPIARPRVAAQDPTATVDRVPLTATETSKAQKYCKFASSALEYEDVEGALDYLTKAMNLLKTGKED